MISHHRGLPLALGGGKGRPRGAALALLPGRGRPEEPAHRRGSALPPLGADRPGSRTSRRWCGSCPSCSRPTAPRRLRADVRAEVIRAALDTPLERPAHEAAVYSDVGFILLGHLLEQLGGAPLDVLFRERVARAARARSRLARLPPAERAAARCLRGSSRPGSPARASRLPARRTLTRAADPRPSPAGEVDDDNGWVMDGVAGHAGLFGTARDVARFGQAVLDELKGRAARSRAALELASRRDPHPRLDPRAGLRHARRAGLLRPARAVSRRALGHLGFTGTSLWVDLASERVVVLLTNRTYLADRRLAFASSGRVSTTRFRGVRVNPAPGTHTMADDNGNIVSQHRPREDPPHPPVGVGGTGMGSFAGHAQGRGLRGHRQRRERLPADERHAQGSGASARSPPTARRTSTSRSRTSSSSATSSAG